MNDNRRVGNDKMHGLITDYAPRFRVDRGAYRALAVPSGDGRLVSELVGVNYALRVTQPKAKTLAFRGFDQAPQPVRIGERQARNIATVLWGRRPKDSRRDLSSLVAAGTHYVLARRGAGRRTLDAFAELGTAIDVVWHRRATDVLDSWLRLVDAVWRLTGAITTHAGQGASLARANTWFAWSQAPRSKSPMSWLVRTLAAGRIRATRSVAEFDDLRETVGSPTAWRDVLMALVMRGSLRDDRHDVLDVRGVPCATYFAQWLRLQTGPKRHTPAGWLDRCAVATLDAAQQARANELLPNVHFVRRADRVVPSADGAEKVLWPSTVFGDETLSALDLNGSSAVSLALADTIHRAASNFARRVMPSLGMWGAFEGVVRSWYGAETRRGHRPLLERRPCLGRAGLVPAGLAPAPRDAAGHDQAWTLADGERPWTTSRLFVAVCDALVLGRPRFLLDPTRFQPCRAGGLASRPALLAALVGFAAGAEASQINKKGASARLTRHVLYREPASLHRAVGYGLSQTIYGRVGSHAEQAVSLAALLDARPTAVSAAFEPFYTFLRDLLAPRPPGPGHSIGAQGREAQLLEQLAVGFASGFRAAAAHLRNAVHREAGLRARPRTTSFVDGGPWHPTGLLSGLDGERLDTTMYPTVY